MLVLGGKPSRESVGESTTAQESVQEKRMVVKAKAKQQKSSVRQVKSKKTGAERLGQESMKQVETPADPPLVADDQRIIDVSEGGEVGQAPRQVNLQVQEPDNQQPSLSLIPHEKFREQVEGLRNLTTIKNDKGEEVAFEGETKDEFIRLTDEGYPVAKRMVEAISEAGAFLYEVRRILKPKKLFLTWMEFTGFPRRSAYNYLQVHESFGDQLPRFSHLGIRKLLAASHLKDCVDYVEQHEEVICKEPAQEFEKTVRKLRAKKKQDGRGRKPTYVEIQGCKLRRSEDGTRISIEGLSKKRQAALFENIKGLLSQGKS